MCDRWMLPQNRQADCRSTGRYANCRLVRVPRSRRGTRPTRLLSDNNPVYVWKGGRGRASYQYIFLCLLFACRYEVDWGDGMTTKNTTKALQPFQVVHTYGSCPKTYLVKIVYCPSGVTTPCCDTYCKSINVS